jgi:branched-chain amino acid transport system permease protein
MSAGPLTSATTWRGPAAVSVVGVLVLLLLPHFLSTYYLGLVIQMMIFALFAMSLDLLIGYTGMASLGHAAYFGVAAYATGLLALKLGWSVWLAFPAGLLVAALPATLFGFLALRTRGSYFLMITLALSQVVWGIAFGWRSLTGGDDGLPEVPRPNLGLPWSLTDETPFYYFVLLCIGLGTFLLIRIVSSPFGFALRGIRESETRMLSLGYNVWRYKLAVFVLAATFAGLAGCLYVYYNRFGSPDYLQVVRSAEVLLMVILSAHTERWLLVLGVIYIAVALFAPRGIVGFLREFRAKKAAP